jgi:peptidylprolyl isomerase
VTNQPEKLLFDLPAGQVEIALRPDLAPNHVARIVELVREGFYDGTPFHRVMDGFMAQGGDPTGTGTGGSGKNIKAEFSQEPFKRGTCGMARAQDPNSADSQFFICLADAEFLNGQYTLWGEVVSGMDAVDALKKAPPSRRSGMVDDPDKLIRARVAGDSDT